MSQQLTSPRPHPSALHRPVAVCYRSLDLGDGQTGVLDIQLPQRRVLSLPAQLGCPVACSFCVSKDAPLRRNLRVHELRGLVQLCADARPWAEQPLELSFTGEGEPLLNWRAIEALCQDWPAETWPFDSVRLCASGMGLSRLLPRVQPLRVPLRLQFSLHAARQAVRDRLVPRSEPLQVLRAALRAEQGRFRSVELNVVLQEGVNDSDEDLQALLDWADPAWLVLLNPLLAASSTREAPRAAAFEAELKRAGRTVHRYQAVATRIVEANVYPLLRSRPTSGSPV